MTRRRLVHTAENVLKQGLSGLLRILRAPVYFGRHPASVPPGAIVLFPLSPNRLGCGIAGLVALRRAKTPERPNWDRIENQVDAVVALEAGSRPAGAQGSAPGRPEGEDGIAALAAEVLRLRRRSAFLTLFSDAAARARARDLAARIGEAAEREAHLFREHAGRLPAAEAERVAERIERLKDIAWWLQAEVLNNVERVEALAASWSDPPPAEGLLVLRDLNAVLNSIDRMEVRGRDSAGLSLLFTFSGAEFGRFEAELGRRGLAAEFAARSAREPLLHGGIRIHRGDDRVAAALTYKVAREIGSLGDNIAFLRREITSDRVLHALLARPARFFTVKAHTRWASVGAITEANCHPVDNGTAGGGRDAGRAVIHACLNGDIDNFEELRALLEREGVRLPPEVTTDTKIIPLWIERHLRDGVEVEEAFRRAVNDFRGSHAIAVHTSLAPGKLFLAQRGSGQAMFVGIAPDHYMATSEVYGFIEETSDYIRLEGEKAHPGAHGPVQGEIAVLDQDAAGGAEGIRLLRYDGTPVPLEDRRLLRSQLTSRDIDRQGYPHYFLKEISESPLSVERTLQNRWRVADPATGRLEVALDERAVPEAIRRRLAGGEIRRVFFIGQGTAGVAAQVAANLLVHYLQDPAVAVQAMKSSELSGFAVGASGDRRGLADALVVAISQSGTTTDTNRAVDLARERGAATIAIVNRRESDLTFKTQGVLYTSSGRDIEMSVASTKAFYAQIVAGALLGLFLARLTGRRDARFVSEELERLRALPGRMRRVLGLEGRIRQSAARLAAGKTYWAVVGSGPNKASADEIRIKLSELCYKTISSDYVEDKKHIDLSSEPLILVCAAGAHPAVLGDLVKDTAIFRAHRATPVVICDEGEERFAPFAEDVIPVPAVEEHLAPVLNTLAGHLWGYHAALAIHEGSRFLFRFQQELLAEIAAAGEAGRDVNELVLDRAFREKVAAFYREFRERRARRELPLALGYDAATDLTLLLKYLSGRLPIADFEIDFGEQGTAANLLRLLLERLAEAVGLLARPVDAIKHQAKTVTVGTSRLEEAPQGLLFEALAREGIAPSRLTPANVIVLRNLQGIVAAIEGSILYRIEGLNLLGEPDEKTRIAVEVKRGATAAIPSRVESDPELKGTKRTIVRQGNVYIGKGRKDDRSILVIPVLGAEPGAAGRIERLLLLHIRFREEVPLDLKIRALGGKFENIKNIVQENSVPWKDEHLELLPIDELFGRSAEKIAEAIVARLAARR